MLLDLIVCKLENLETIGESCLGSLGFSKVIDNLLIGIGLFDIVVVEIYYCIAIREDFSFHSIVKNDFFLSIFVDTLNLSIISNDLFGDLHVAYMFVMILRHEFYIIIFIFILFFIRLGKVFIRIFIFLDFILFIFAWAFNFSRKFNIFRAFLMDILNHHI